MLNAKFVAAKLVDLREEIQDDLMCLLDGQEDYIVDNACQIAVDRINSLMNLLEIRNV